MADIYDGAFRTIINDCRKFILPMLNEMFEENYTGSEKIEFFPNEHFISQKNEGNQERITDTNFIVHGYVDKKYHWECQSTPDKRMLIRLFEYDAQIALDQGEITNETLIVTFPNTAVLYLRHYMSTPENMKYIIHTPGGTVEYNVPVMKMQTYTIEEIFDKELFLLIPFYIFLYEKSFPVYNKDEEKLMELAAEYENIRDRLDILEKKGILGVFDKHTILELSDDVLQEIARKYENVRKKVGGIMSGPLLETKARAIKKEGIIQGIEQGIEQGRMDAYIEMIRDGLITIQEAAARLKISVEFLQTQIK